MTLTYLEWVWFAVTAALLGGLVLSWSAVRNLLKEIRELRRQGSFAQTARQDAEQEAAQAEQLITDLVNVLPVAVFRLRQEADGRRWFPYVRGHTEQFIALTAEEMLATVDKPTFPNILEPSWQAAREALDASIAQSAPFQIDLQSRREEGSGWVEVGMGVPKPLPGGSYEWNAYVIDVTEKRLQEQALTEAKQAAEHHAQAKARFLAAMSHEIRTPLATTVGALELLRGTQLNAEQSSHLELADSSAQLLLEILGAILDYSRLEAGQVQLEAVPLDLRELLEQITLMFSLAARAKGLTLDLHVADDVPHGFCADPVRIKQILLNLLGNAVKFTASGGITVTAKLGDAEPGQSHLPVTIAVADSGIGIAPEAEAQLFQPFSQADSSTSRKYGGSGLGLTISQRLAELFGGRIHVRSTLGQGSVFTVVLPLAPLAAEPPQPLAPAQSSPACSAALQPPHLVTAPAEAFKQNALTGKPSRRILVVEDHLPYQIVIQSLIAKLGLDCQVASNGVLALQRLNEERYDLVLTDCHMPDMDGFELSRRIRQHQDGAVRNLPIIALTADASQEQVQRYCNAGMNDYLTKPVKLAVLRDCVAKWIN